MNNDSTSISGPSATPLNGRRLSSSRRRQDSRTPAQRRAYDQMIKKCELASSLITNIDFAIYCQLGVLYYMDCSFFQLCMRALTQFLILTPKPRNVRQPQNFSMVIMLLGTNILCIFLHLFLAPMRSSEEMRGYLHGGIIVDLIGQKGPSSKLKLVVLDLLVLTLQATLFTIHLDTERLDEFLTAYGKKTTTHTQIQFSTQDHDFEERGVLRDHVAGLEDIEMQRLDAAGVASRPDYQENITEEDEDDERGELLAEPVNTESDDAPWDIFWSGTAVIGEFSVLDTLRSQLRVSGSASGSFRAHTLSVDVDQLTARNPRLGALARTFQRSMGQDT